MCVSERKIWVCLNGKLMYLGGKFVVLKVYPDVKCLVVGSVSTHQEVPVEYVLQGKAGNLCRFSSARTGHESICFEQFGKHMKLLVRQCFILQGILLIEVHITIILIIIICAVNYFTLC